MRQAQRAAADDPRITVWAEPAVLAHLTGWAMPLPDEPFAGALRDMDERRRDCALAHAVDEAVAARAAVISAQVSPGPLAAHVTAAMRRALADGSWLCDQDEPQFLAPPYWWVLVLEALQAACCDGPDGGRPHSAEWEGDYGRPIPGHDCAAQLETVARWHHNDQRDTGRLHAVAWGQRPEAALESATCAKAGEEDRAERMASQLSAFTAPCRWPLDYLTPPGPGREPGYG